MEVRIKKRDEFIDVTIKIIDDSIAALPKNVKFEPKDGDVVSVDSGSQIFICKDYIGDRSLYAYIGLDFEYNRFFKEGEWFADRFATEEEKKLFFDKLSEAGYEWKADTKELVKLKWEPNSGEKYWYPSANNAHFEPLYLIWRKSVRDHNRLESGWCFKSEKECQAFCDRLNEAINQVKP